MPQGVYCNREGFAGARGFKQGISQPRCVVALKIKCLAEHPSLVSTARVRRVQTIIPDLADIEDGLIAMRQMRRHAGARTSRLVAFSEYISGSRNPPSCHMSRRITPIGPRFARTDGLQSLTARVAFSAPTGSPPRLNQGSVRKML